MNLKHNEDCLADEPADAAYHLVAALGCCDPPKATTTRHNRVAEVEIMNL
jgi:hypothetical protein